MSQGSKGQKWLLVLLQPINLLTVFASFCTGVAFLGKVYWAFEFATLYYVQYCVILLICAVVFLFVRKRVEAIVSVAFAAINLAFLVPFYVPVHAPQPEQGERKCPDCGGPLPKRKRYCPACAARKRKDAAKRGMKRLRERERLAVNS